MGALEVDRPGDACYLYDSYYVSRAYTLSGTRKLPGYLSFSFINMWETAETP